MLNSNLLFSPSLEKSPVSEVKIIFRTLCFTSQNRPTIIAVDYQYYKVNNTSISSQYALINHFINYGVQVRVFYELKFTGKIRP